MLLTTIIDPAPVPFWLDAILWAALVLGPGYFGAYAVEKLSPFLRYCDSRMVAAMVVGYAVALLPYCLCNSCSPLPLVAAAMVAPDQEGPWQGLIC